MIKYELPIYTDVSTMNDRCMNALDGLSEELRERFPHWQNMRVRLMVEIDKVEFTLPDSMKITPRVSAEFSKMAEDVIAKMPAREQYSIFAGPVRVATP